MSSYKKHSYSYSDFFKSQTCGNEKQKAYADPDETESEKDSVHLRYSRKHDTVTVNYGTKKVHYNLEIFIERYIAPYLNIDGTIQDNPLNLTKEHVDFFMNIRSRQKKDRSKVNLEKNKPSKLSELVKLGITDRASYKRWCVRNHPDKVSPDKKDEATELFKRISVLCVSFN
jgi:hypothetical protein